MQNATIENMQREHDTRKRAHMASAEYKRLEAMPVKTAREISDMLFLARFFGK